MIKTIILMRTFSRIRQTLPNFALEYLSILKTLKLSVIFIGNSIHSVSQLKLSIVASINYTV